MLATLFWQGDAADTNWGTAGNWADDIGGTDTGALPMNGDTLVFNTNTTGFATFTPNNNIDGLTEIDIQIVDDSGDGDFSIGGDSSVELSATGITNGGTSVGTTTINTPLTLGATAAITNNVAAGVGLSVGSTINNGGNLLTSNTAAGGQTNYLAVISGGGGLTTSGNTVLNANNSYGGVTTIESGVLATGVNGALGDTAQPTVVQIGANLDFQGVNYVATEPVTLAGGSIRATNNLASTFAGNITVTADSNLAGFADADSLNLTGIISGDFGVNIGGTGTTIMSGVNMYTGATSVNTGTLQIDGSTAAASTVTVNADATLSGTGNAMGTVDIQDGGIIAPGNSPGILNTGSMNAMDGSTYNVEINNPGAAAGFDFDQINVTGSVTIGNLTFALSGTEVPTAGDQYIIINNDGADPVNLGANAPAEGSIVGQLSGQALRINYHAGDGNDVALFSGVISKIITANDLALGTGGDGSPDTFRITNAGANIQVSVNGTNLAPLPRAATSVIIIKGSIDDDTLIIDNSEGLITAAIRFDGDGTTIDSSNALTPNPVIAGPGFDTLQLIGDTVAETTYNPGIATDAGSVFQVAGNVTQRLDFVGLEPVQLVGGGAGATMNLGGQLAAAGFPAALNASNAINYTAGPNGGVAPFVGMTSGLVTVDGFETFEFANFGTLLINAGPGSDEISLNNPNTPSMLAGITVTGGDPTAGSDTAIISGTAGADAINFAATTDDDAVVIGAGPVPITLATVESTVIDGQGGNDTLTVSTPATGESLVFTPGAHADAGMVDQIIPSGTTLLPLKFLDIGEGGTVAFVDAAGRTDDLVIRGTDGSDVFTLNAAGSVTVADQQNTPLTPTLTTAGVDELLLRGIEGDDLFLVPGNLPFNGATGVVIEGGNPDNGSDVLNLLGAAATVENVVITQNPVNPTTQAIAGLGAMMIADGVELITYTGNADARDDTLVVETTTGADTIRVDEQAAGVTARVTSEQMPNIDFTNVATFQLEAPLAPPPAASDPGAVTATFATLNLDPITAYQFIGGSEDVLVVEGADTFPDFYSIINPIAGPAGGNVIVTDIATGVVVTNLTAGPFAPGEVRLNTLGGDDQVNVDVGAGGFGGVDLIDTRIVFDGGAGSDNLTISGTPGTPITNEVYTPGPDPTSGKIDFGTAGSAANLTGTAMTGTMQIEFKNLQPVQSLAIATNLTVNASNANNAISYAVGPNTGVVNLMNPLGANTGLVSVDNNETIEFANKTVLTLNGLAGDDIINLEHTAAVPTGLTFVVGSGGFGRDVVDASGDTTGIPLLLLGGADDDTLIGGLGGDILLGGVGSDTLVDSPGNDYFDGGNNGQIPGAIPAGIGFPAVPGALVLPPAVADPVSAAGGVDSVVVRGSGLSDVLNVIQNAPTGAGGAGYPLAVVNSAGGAAIPPPTADVLATVVAGAVPNAAGSRSSIEDVRIEAGAGNDQIAVGHADVYSSGAGTPQQMVRFDVRGHAPDASDRLVVRDLGLGDVVLIRQSANERTGRVTVAPTVNTTTLSGFNGDIVYSGIENIDVTPLNPFNGGTGADGLGRVVVFQADPFESNDALPVATDLGDLTTIQRDPTIDPGNFAGLFGPNADEDWYVFTATKAGTAKLDLLFTAIGLLANGRAGLPGGGALAVGVYSAAGTLISAGSGLTNAGGTAIGQTVQFATLPNTRYFVRVTGAPLTAPPAASASVAINTYDLTLTANSDGLGPQVIDPDGPGFPAQAIQIVDNPFFNLFTSKPASGPAGPTPPVNGLTINFRDPISSTQTGIATGATLGALDAATALNPGNYSLIGDATGPVTITGVSFAHPATTPSVIGAVLAAGPNTATAFNIGAALNPPPAGANGNSSAIVGQTIQWTGGPNTGLTGRIVSYNNGTGVATVAIPFPLAAATGDAFIIMPVADVVSPVTLLQGVTVAPGYVAPAVNGAGAFSGDVNIAANPAAAYIGQSVQVTDNSANTALLGPEQRTIVGVTAGGAFVFNQPFSGNVPAGTTFNIVGTTASAQGVVGAAPTATTFGSIATPANNFGNASVAGAALSAINGFYVGQALTFTNGPLAGQSRLITAYNAGGGIFSFSQPFTTLPRVGDHFLIGPAAPPPVQGGAAGAASTATTIIGTPAVIPAAGASVGGLSTTPGDYVGQLLVITSGALTGETQLINSYNGAGVFTVANPFSAAPVGAAFVITLVNQAAVTINFAGPLPDDRFTLTVSDAIRDYAGNALDGENSGTFPSGDGVSGGNFVVRFNVDARAEIGTWSAGSVYLDTNGNFTFDPNNADAANRDIVHTLGFTTDHIFAGDFNGNGYDELGAYAANPAGGIRWLIDTTDNGVPDTIVAETSAPALVGIPVAGNFGLPAIARDVIGLFTGAAWVFDTDGNFDLGTGNPGPTPTAMSGLPFVGDFDGDGLDDLGTYNAVTNTFQLSLTTVAGGGFVPAAGPIAITNAFTINFGAPFIGVRERPVAGDMDGDGIDDIGLWVPDRSGVAPSEAGEWYFLVSGGASIVPRLVGPPLAATISYTPAPFGNDLFAQFGDEFAIPLVGNFDPPPQGSSPTTNPTPIGSPVEDSETTDVTDITPLPVTPTTPEPTAPTPNPTVPTATTGTAPVVVAGFGTLTIRAGFAIPEFDLNRVFSDDGERAFSVIENTNPELVIASILDGRLRLQAVEHAGGMAKITVEARDTEGNAVQDTLELHVIAVDEPVVQVVPPSVPMVDVNQPPIAVAATNIHALDNSEPIQVDLKTKFADADDSVLGYQMISNSNPELVRAVILESQLTLHVTEGVAGTANIQVRAVDGDGGTATHLMVVQITSTNQAPVASGVTREITVQQDAPAQQLDLNSLFSDPDGDKLHYQIFNSNSSLVSLQLVDAALDLLFAPGASGQTSIGITATDPEGLQAEIELRIDVEEKPASVTPVDAVTDDQVAESIPPIEDVPISDSAVSTELPAEVQPSPRPRLSLRSFLAR